MSKKTQGLLLAFGLLLFGSKAHALPVSECVEIGPVTQDCKLYESDDLGNRSKVSSPVTSFFAPIYGADWAPRWVLVYGLTRKGLPKKKPSHIVVVTKPESSQSFGLFADTAILYTRGGKIFKGILQQALEVPLCVDNSEPSACVLIKVKDANGVATFEQPFVFNSQDPGSLIEGFDTIDVLTGPTPPTP